MHSPGSTLCLSLLENTPSFIIILDESQSIYWINQSFCDFLGLERDKLVGLNAEQSSEPCLKQVLNAKERVEPFAGMLNKWIELQEKMQVRGRLSEQDAEQQLTVYFYMDATKYVQTERQLMQLESTLTHKLSHDPVTGMLNHHSMYQTLNSEVSRSRRYNNPLSLILMNVEYQPEADSASQQSVQYDSLSHEKQEQVRLMISQLLKDQMRWADIVGHIDGYDFVLLLPETQYESAEILVKKLNSNLQQFSSDIRKISFGISQWQKGDDVQLFVARASDSMAQVLLNE